jgi:hypothetical protein
VAEHEKSGSVAQSSGQPEFDPDALAKAVKANFKPENTDIEKAEKADKSEEHKQAEPKQAK